MTAAAGGHPDMFNGPTPGRERFIADILSNRNNKAILDAWDALALADGWLVAGCLFQTVWNVLSGRAPEADIKDYDIFYFDGSDLDQQAEQRMQARVGCVFGDLGVTVEVMNQARVHLWYEEHFGYPCPALQSVREGIDRFLVPATSVAIRPAAAGWEVYAPNGLAALYAGILAPNPLTDHRPLFRAKAQSYRRRWPWLQILESEGRHECDGSRTTGAEDRPARPEAPQDASR